VRADSGNKTKFCQSVKPFLVSKALFLVNNYVLVITKYT